MLRGLSQKAINNIVIFSMLIMMALFNLDKLLPTPSPVEVQPLITSQAYVLKIEHDNAKLERTGQQWRQVSSLPPDITPEEQISAWQRASLEWVDNIPTDLLDMTPHVVVVWLAGEPQGLVYGFYPFGKLTYVTHNENWYLLFNAELFELLPWIEGV